MGRVCGPVALVGAMPMEVAPYLQRMQDVRCEDLGPFAFHCGTAFGVPVVAMQCGVGKVNAAMAAQALIERCAPALVLHTGVGGSLTGALGLLDALIARDCVQYDVDTTALGDPPGMISTIERVSLPCDAGVAAGLLDAAAACGIRALPGRAATGDRFLTAAAEKTRHCREVRRADLRSGERRHCAGLLCAPRAVRHRPRRFRRHRRRPRRGVWQFCAARGGACGGDRMAFFGKIWK